MGCWSETCGLTQLPISEGDPIVAFLLVNSFGYIGNNGFCYMDDFYTPIGFLIHGKYNDDGNIENVENKFVEEKMIDLIVEQIRARKVVPNGTKFTKKEYEEACEIISLSQVIDLIHEHDIVVKKKTLRESEKYDTHMFSRVFFHRDIYDVLIEEVSKRTVDNYTLAPPIPRRTFLEKINRKLDIFILAHENMPKDPAYINKTGRWSLMRYFTDNELLFKAEEIISNEVIGYYLALGAFQRRIIPMEGLLNDIEALKEPTYRKAILDNLKIRTVMMLMRKFWSPQAGTGMQSKECGLHKVMALKMLSHIKLIEDKYEQENKEEMKRDPKHPYLRSIEVDL